MLASHSATVIGGKAFAPSIKLYSPIRFVIPTDLYTVLNYLNEIAINVCEYDEN